MLCHLAEVPHPGGELEVALGDVAVHWAALMASLWRIRMLGRIFLIQFSQGLVPGAWCRRHVWRLVQTFKSGQPPLLDRQHLVTISWAQDTLDLSCCYQNIKKHPKTFQTHSNLRSLLLMNISQGLYVLQSYMKPQFDKNRRTWNWSNTPDILNKNYETSEQLI